MVVGGFADNAGDDNLNSAFIFERNVGGPNKRGEIKKINPASNPIGTWPTFLTVATN